MKTRHNTLKLTATWLLVVVIGASVVSACDGGEQVPPLERRAQEVNKTVMCPVCPGESIDQSQHPLSVQMRAIVVEKLQAGWTEGQTKDFFVERYGPSVLLEPPTRGFDALVWVVPPVGLALAAAVLYLVLRSMVGPGGRQEERAIAGPGFSNGDQDDYLSRVREELDEDGGAGIRDRPAASKRDEAG